MFPWLVPQFCKLYRNESFHSCMCMYCNGIHRHGQLRRILSKFRSNWRPYLILGLGACRHGKQLAGAEKENRKTHGSDRRLGDRYIVIRRHRETAFERVFGLRTPIFRCFCHNFAATQQVPRLLACVLYGLWCIMCFNFVVPESQYSDLGTSPFCCLIVDKCQ